jgi:hypothetical protein
LPNGGSGCRSNRIRSRSAVSAAPTRRLGASSQKWQGDHTGTRQVNTIVISELDFLVVTSANSGTRKCVFKDTVRVFHIVGSDDCSLTRNSSNKEIGIAKGWPLTCRSTSTFHKISKRITISDTDSTSTQNLDSTPVFGLWGCRGQDGCRLAGANGLPSGIIHWIWLGKAVLQKQGNSEGAPQRVGIKSPYDSPFSNVRTLPLSSSKVQTSSTGITTGGRGVSVPSVVVEHDD